MKQLYRDLDVAGVYRDYEETSYGEIVKLIDSMQDMPPAIFLDFAKRIYKRSK